MNARRFAALAATVAALDCGRAPAAPPAAPSPVAVPVATPAAPRYLPGLGELMTSTQMRHAKLWFAGSAGNWELAAYELDELNEGFDEIVLYHPAHKDSPVPIDEAVRTMMTQPLAALAEAIKAKDRTAFAAAYDTVTEGCNSCHQASNFGFNVVQRPKSNPFSNQSFAPAP